MADKPEAIAFEPHADVNQTEVAVAVLGETVVLDADKPYVTNDPAVIAELDAAEHVKRVAKAETKTEAKAKAEKA